MQDVADHARVSIATVSFVVNGTKAVAPATRLKVEQAMSELGFTRNMVARALATRRSRIIALLFPELDHRLNPTALRFVQAAVSAASERDHHLVVWPVSNDPVALRGYLDGGLVDGVLAMEVQIDDPRVAVLDAARVPYVLIGRTGDTSGYGFVDIDFETSTIEALNRLRALGHERIALVLEEPGALALDGSTVGYGPPVRTERAYRDFQAAHDAAPLVVFCARTPVAGRAAVQDLLAADPAPTAAIVMNDEAAPGIVTGLRAAGFEVPERFSVMGLAMSPTTAVFVDPVMDHLAAPAEELGRAAADALIDHLDDPDAPSIHTLLPCVYEQGGTLAPLR